MRSVRPPRVLQAALVRLPPGGGEPPRAFAFPYNPEALRRTWKERPGGGPPVETAVLTLMLDATDGLERPDEHPQASRHGVSPALSALELLLHPSADPPPRKPLPWRRSTGRSKEAVTLFLWGDRLPVPVRLTGLKVLEELHDPSLTPLRARARVTMQVLSAADLPPGHSGAAFWQAHLAETRDLARSAWTAPPVPLVPSAGPPGRG